MGKQKSTVTRTYGPIHFEDLDPHRFEDLIRELIYDFKDWRSIEATGRSGNDEGFDIRAYEKATVPASEDGEDEEQEAPHPMEGNLWMVQGKREKEIGPTKVKSIVQGIDQENPPYGYILAASANFSKDSYDVFRKELRKKGVMEFYLWGKAELEDMLHLPKNDRILFTFFGISLVTRRRSRTTEARAAIAVKNKLYRVLDESPEFYRPVLIRDLSDAHYPFKDKYEDFRENPRWREYTAFAHHPLGLWVHMHKYFGYLDREKKEWDFTESVDLLSHETEDDGDRQSRADKQTVVESVWEYFPRSKQAHYCIDGIVKYGDIMIVDEKGDFIHHFPHLHVDFSVRNGPFAGFRYALEMGRELIDPADDYKRIKVFPDTFTKPIMGTIHPTPVTLDAKTLEDFKAYRNVEALYDADGRYALLEVRDVITIAGMDEGTYLQITHKAKMAIGHYFREAGNRLALQQSIRRQIGREFDEGEEIGIYEIKRIYKHQLVEPTTGVH